MYFKISIHVGTFVCNVSSPSYNTVEVSCKLLGNLARVNVTLNCTSRIGGLEYYTVVDDSPIVIPSIPAGNYTVDTTAVDINFRTVEMIAVADNVTTSSLPTYGPTTDATITNTTTTDVTTTNETITGETSTDASTTNVTATNETTTSVPSPITSITTTDATTTNETIATGTIPDGVIANRSTTEDATSKYSVYDAINMCS